MSQAKPAHSAAQSAAGYLYQARLALAECLRYAYGDSSVEIAIEKLDDVSFEKAGTALELVGSYHILAEDLRVGWHRDFEALHADEPAEPADA